MAKSFNQTLLKAGRLTGMGRLLDATRVIQRALVSGKVLPSAPALRKQARAATEALSNGLGLALAGHQALMPKTPETPQTPGAAEAPAAPITTAETKEPKEARAPAQPQAPLADDPIVLPKTARAAHFSEGVFKYGTQPYPYRLYIPARAADAAATPMPLIVLLHGCTQSAKDFAQGTAMNELAEKHKCMVLYPEQTQKANSARCWNWFEPGHQQRGRGEPGMIAGLTRKVLSSQGGDAGRVYIAGLSAGGAMASVVARLYPELFTALGVHSGLPAGAAQDMLSAFSAMRNGAAGLDAKALPTIVFHGSADKTVHPDNGAHISQAALAALNGSGLALVKSQSTRGAKTERSTQRTTYRDATGASYVEHWNVEEGPHAWFGGDAAGSYTDPASPSASAAMMEFFLQHEKPPKPQKAA